MSIAVIALDPFNSKNPGKQAQSFKPFEIKDPLVDKILEQFQDDVYNYSNVEIKDVLTPSQIQVAVHRMVQKPLESREGPYLDHRAGVFISNLVQGSYNTGYNNFILNTDAVKIGSLCVCLEGTKENRLQLRIEGTVGYQSLGWSQHIDCRVEGDVWTDFAYASKYSRFYIDGNAQDNCASGSFNTAVHASGKIERGWGMHAWFSRFSAQTFGVMQHHRRSVFDQSYIFGCSIEVKDLKSYEAIWQEFGPIGYFNKIRLTKE